MKARHAAIKAQDAMAAAMEQLSAYEADLVHLRGQLQDAQQVRQRQEDAMRASSAQLTEARIEQVSHVVPKSACGILDILQRSGV